MNNIEAIAAVCHEVNRAYREALGESPSQPWESAPDNERSSAIVGVKFHLDSPHADPRSSHECWLAEKEASGWKYGPVKDADRKEHPCFVPYDQLPVEQLAKDYLFRAVVHACAKHFNA
jgi:hypothetical protein